MVQPARSSAGKIVTSVREERTAQHCVLTTQALLRCNDELKDVGFKCGDDVVCRAHKFVLGSMSQYFRSKLYKNGAIGDVSENSIKGKHYRFPASSQCFRFVTEYLYTGQILQIQNASEGIDSVLDQVAELLTVARQPNNEDDGMGGMDLYLIQCLSKSKPPGIRSAMKRLGMGLKCRVQEVVDETKGTIPKLKFSVDAFKDVEPDVVELVLRDVALNVPEIEVFRAVKAWYEVFFDDYWDDEPVSPTSSAISEAPPLLPEALKSVLKYVDLECINHQQIKNEIAPLKKFDKEQIAKARRSHAIKGTGMQPSRPSDRRGQVPEGAGTTEPVLDP